MLDLESGLGPRFTLMVGDAVWVVCHTASHYEANHVPVSVKLSLITWRTIPFEIAESGEIEV